MASKTRVRQRIDNLAHANREVQQPLGNVVALHCIITRRQ
jgi:hypothetical protein